MMLQLRTECDNYSALNFNTRATESGIAASATGKSGTTLEGFFFYICARRPRLVVWENSDKTKAKDLEHLSNQLRKVGYLTWWDKVDAKSYSPQSRLRIYLIAAIVHSENNKFMWSMSDEDNEAFTLGSWLPMAFELLHSLAGNPFTLEQFLLPDDHEEVRGCKGAIGGIAPIHDFACTSCGLGMAMGL